ncbi:hypothetical protein PPYR_07791 [Photinus pyralis]|uniref:Haemolymph juvenile hormone binding protein n=1 Tax=Photinus pyralis TaxID=7054 RepID=A0A5N4ARG0_PHOPY|nr:uncharacterized protein LOC116168800 [Photinus pyralis]KAB0799911.1 hypothetical protein PPYR_07791 [Photinus pyralis]
MRNVTVFSVLFLGCIAQQLPASFKVCDHFAPDVNACLKDAILSALGQLKDGLPEIGAVALEPLHIANITVHKFGNEFSFINVMIDHLSTVAVTDLHSDLTREKFWLEFNMTADDIIAEMDYSIKGKLLMFSVDGGGRGELHMKNMVIQATLIGGVTSDGKYYNLDDLNLKLYPKMVKYRLENIVPGQKEISDQINDVLNDTWDLLWDAFKVDLEEILDKFFLEYANNILKYVPISP